MKNKDKTAIQELMSILSEHDIQPTTLRIELLSYLLSIESHPTREQIYDTMCETYGKCSLASVYNTVNLFVEKGLLSSLNIHDKHVHYDSNLNQHGHFQCRTCNKLIDFPLNLDLCQIPQLDGFTCEISEIIIHGVCPDCSRS